MKWYHWACPSPQSSPPLPGPPVFSIFFGGDGKPPWLRGPKAHTPHGTFLHVGFESLRFLSIYGSHWNGTSPPCPSTHTHIIEGICVQALVSGFWFDKEVMMYHGLAISHGTSIVTFSQLNHWLNILDNLWPAVPVTPVPPDLLLWEDRPLFGRTDFPK